MEPTKQNSTTETQSSKGGVMVSDLTESEKMLFAEMCMYFTDQGIAAPTRLIIEKIISERDNH
jgi:hypothetical protein